MKQGKTQSIFGGGWLWMVDFDYALLNLMGRMQRM